MFKLQEPASLLIHSHFSRIMFVCAILLRQGHEELAGRRATVNLSRSRCLQCKYEPAQRQYEYLEQWTCARTFQPLQSVLRVPAQKYNARCKFLRQREPVKAQSCFRASLPLSLTYQQQAA